MAKSKNETATGQKTAAWPVQQHTGVTDTGEKPVQAASLVAPPGVEGP